MRYLFEVLFPFLRNLFRSADAPQTVVILGNHDKDALRKYIIHPHILRRVLFGSIVFNSLLVASLVAFTPLRNLIPGSMTTEFSENARLIALRLANLEDSLHAQEMYLANLQSVFTGELGSGLTADERISPAESQSDSFTLFQTVKIS